MFLVTVVFLCTYLFISVSINMVHPVHIPCVLLSKVEWCWLEVTWPPRLVTLPEWVYKNVHILYTIFFLFGRTLC